MRTIFALLLSALSCLAQSGMTFRDISFLGNIPTAQCGNSVTWAPAASTLDWWDTNGNPHYTADLAQFNTNCFDAVQKIDAQGFVGNYITNFTSGFGELTNLTVFQVGTENGLETIGVNGLPILTNIAINSNPDLITFDLGADGIVDPISVNISQNPNLFDLPNFDAGSMTRLDLWAMNNCALTDQTMTNVACYIYGQIVANSLSNGTFNCQANAESIADPSCIWAMTNYGWTINY